ncbi:alkaline phosphatase [Puteibacter caeruleilacunae]|nr:alkaline phosphatase [Puteibacter caeruleilacunae]
MKRLVLLAIVIVLCASSFAQEKVAYNGKEWRRKQNREEFALMIKGKPDEAIKHMEDFLKSGKADTAEVVFGLSVAHFIKGDVKNGTAWFSRALGAGIAVERFMAGPRDIFKPLYTSKVFKRAVGTHELIHGPMLGAVTDTEARVWIRTFHEVEFKVSIATDMAMKNVIGSFIGTTAEEDDFTGIAQITELKAKTKYYYTLEVQGKRIEGTHHFTTFAKEGSKGKVRIGFGGCAAYNPEFEHMWKVIENRNPDAFLILGDNVYIDHPESPETQRFCYYQRESSPHFKSMTSNIPYYSVWDDHDFGANDAFGGPERFTPSWKLKVHDIYKENFVNPSYGGGKENPGIWYNFTIGDVEFFMIDTRYYRTSSNAKQPNMLGTYQMEWLKKTLKESTATFKVIVSSIPWSDAAKDAMDGRYDTWRGYPEERKEIFDYLTANKIEGVILLAADRHRHDVWKHKRENDYALYEFTSSRLTNIHYHELRKDALFGYNEKNGFAVLEFETDRKVPVLTYKIINIDNELINQIKVYYHQIQTPK